MKTLKAPLRVYWDLVPEQKGGLGKEAALAVASELALLRVFFVTLLLSDGRRDDLPGLVSRTRKGGARITLSILNEGSFPDCGHTAEADVINIQPDDAASLKRMLDRMPPESSCKPLSVSLVPKKRGASAAGEVITAAVESGIRSFNFINPDLVRDAGRTQDYILGDRDRNAYKRVVESRLGPLGLDVKVFVHDLFLHDILDLPGLGGRIEYVGCQAGDAVVYIDREGTLYPCSSFPMPLGDLKKNSIKKLWGMWRRRELRKKLGALPKDCESCTFHNDCRGGCRGLAFLTGGLDSRDPSCGR